MAVAFIWATSFLPVSLYAEFRNNMNADIVVGQPSFEEGVVNNGGRSARSIHNPKHIFVGDGKLFIAEEGNNRIVIFNEIPSGNFQEADVVVGQADFSSRVNGVTNATTFDAANGVWAVNGKMFMADVTGNRGLIYNRIPTKNGAAADVVVGQDTFTATTNNKQPLRTRNPRGVFSDGTRFVLANDISDRFHVFNTIPTSNNAPADITIRTLANGSNLDRVRFAMSDGSHFFVVDRDNNRVLIWNTAYPTDSADMPDVVVGQPDFIATQINQGGGPGPNTLSSPQHVSSDGKRLFIADGNNRRVLIYNQIPTENNAPS